MNAVCAHCVAKQEDKVVGYALSMTQDFRNDIPILRPMFEETDMFLKQHNLNINYIVMGQVCVAKLVRGKDVFRSLYKFMDEELKAHYNAIVTEVDTKNRRSSEAHQKVGFKIIKNYTSKKQLWEIIKLDI